MTTLSRVTGKVFGGSAPLDEIGQFGSAKAGTPTNTQDVATIQALPAYAKGWGSGVVTSRNFPPVEEVTGVLKTISYQTCYLLQEGIPTYDANTEYSATSIVKDISGDELILYISQMDGNKNHSLSSNTYWHRVIFQGTLPVGVPQFTLDFNTLPNNCVWLEGQNRLMSDYPNLYAIYGTTYNRGDEADGYFRFPDFRNRAIYGANSAGYITAALPDLKLSTSTAGAHTHTRGTMNITGTVSGLSYDQNDSRLGMAGAFSWITETTKNGAGSGTNDRYADFDASKTWTGETSSNGAHTHSITSTNSIVGQAATNKVWTDGIKVRVYTRYR